MRRMIVRIGATGAGVVLALGLFAAPPAGADGSSKDKAEQNGKVTDGSSKDKGEPSAKVTCFNDSGHTQGRSLSDPDGTSNGGADKPGCADERVDPWDADLDNDGNNGCGNDADREDDNNGNCGHEKAQGSDDDSPDVEDGDDGDDTTTVDGDDTTDTTDTVEGDVKVQAVGSVPEVGVTAADTAAPTSVLGVSLTAPGAEATTSTATPETQVLGETLSAPDTLARTGAGIGGLALLGGLLFGSGRLMVLTRRFLRID